MFHGPAYWSVSPATGERETTSGGIPIGFLDDAEYLSPLHRWLSSAAMAVPSGVRHLRDVEAFQYATLRSIVARRGLSLVSVWNPTFFSLLLARLPEWRERLAADVASGAAGGPGLPRQRPDPVRARQIEASIAITDPVKRHRAVWPRLRLLSAWSDAHAARPFEALAASLPQAFAQPKGLLATEGVVTLPRVGQPGAAVALTSHVVEFWPLAGGRARWVDEVVTGERYEILLTTGGGFTRYRLGDVVEVVGFEQACPLLRFIGRATPVSDRVGEKLHDEPVRRALTSALSGLPHRFILLAPEAGTPDRYVFYAETDAPDAGLWRAAREIDQRLSVNIHYAHARRLGQLGPIGVFRIREGGAQAYLDGCVALGQRLGDIKPVALHRDDGWSARFQGEPLAPTA
ncbi:MAG: GH3 auxin-responsive promoter family protein [Bacteroidota bacterium]